MNRRILAVDLGTKRVGLAITDEDGEFAFNHKTLHIKGREDSINQLIKEIKSLEISLVIIGLPLNVRGESTKQSRYFDKIITELKEAMPDVRFETWNEMLTSNLAIENAKFASYKKKMIDSEAARIMLEEYLNSKL